MGFQQATQSDKWLHFRTVTLSSVFLLSDHPRLSPFCSRTDALERTTKRTDYVKTITKANTTYTVISSAPPLRPMPPRVNERLKARSVMPTSDHRDTIDLVPRDVLPRMSVGSECSRTHNSGARSDGLLDIRQDPETESRKAGAPPVACAVLAACPCHRTRRGDCPRSFVGWPAKSLRRAERDRGEGSPNRTSESRTAKTPAFWAESRVH